MVPLEFIYLKLLKHLPNMYLLKKVKETANTIIVLKESLLHNTTLKSSGIVK